MASDNESQLIAPAAFTPRVDGDGPRQRRVGPLQLALAGVLLLFTASLWFLFTAKSVLFTFDPAYSELDIDGGIQLKIGERYLLRSGDYQLDASAQGHYPLERDLTVTSDDSQEVHLVLKRLPGKVTFESRPPGAQVLVDGEVIGSSPLASQPIPAGEHELKILAERYLPYRASVDVTGMEVAQTFTVELEPAWANIAISSVPIGATVFVDGVPVGQTPSMVEILQGEHQVELQLNRYRSWQQTLSVRAGVHQNLEPVTLLPADGILALSSRPSGANVTVDGEFQGQTPLDLSLEPEGEHRVAVFKPGYSRATRTVSLEPEEERALQVTLKPQLGEVQLRLEPEQPWR
jgi:hypothetical protein